MKPGRQPYAVVLVDSNSCKTYFGRKFPANYATQKLFRHRFHLRCFDRGHTWRARNAPPPPNLPAPMNWSAEQDHRNMMEQLGIKTLRPGADGMNPQGR